MCALSQRNFAFSAQESACSPSVSGFWLVLVVYGRSFLATSEFVLFGVPCMIGKTCSLTLANVAVIQSVAAVEAFGSLLGKKL